MPNRRAALRLGVLGASLAAGFSQAQEYPSRPIRLVVPFPPGGPTDIVGRLLADRLGQALGQPVVVDNRAGAGGTIGADAVAKAPADGYTLLYGSTSTLAISPSVYKKLAYDTATAFAPVALVSRGQQLLVVHPQVPANTLAELVAYSKQHPDAFSYSSPGNGTPGHLAGELLKELTGLRALHVPYKGGAPALQAVLSGEARLMVDAVPTSLQHVRAGRLKALAMLSPQRSEVLPAVPTVKEAGFPEVSADFWSGIVAPAGTPAATVQRLNTVIRKLVATAEFRERLTSIGAEPQDTSPQAFAAFIGEELRKWAAVAQRADVKPD